MRDPETIAELTAEWLDNVLRAGGHLTRGHVVDFDCSTIGEGSGFLGELGQVRPAYDDGDADGPESFIAKMPAPAPGNRELANALGLYQREVGFYQGFADPSVLRTPACLYATEPDAEGRFCLLLEDVGRMRVGDQLAGASADDLRRAVPAIARFHARWWEAPELADIPWLPMLSDASQAPIYEDYYRVSVEPFFARWSDRVSAADRQVIEGMAESWPGWLAHFSQPPLTLTHGDYRLDNLFFGDDGEFCVVDWQVMYRARSANDIGYLLGHSVDPAVRERHEEDLLTAYHETLVAEGVRGYSRTDLSHDYAVRLLGDLIQPIAGLGHPDIDLGNERGLQVFLAMLQRTLAAIHHHRAGDLLPL